jgi:polyisoprenoid-binding protein YceI
MRILLSFITLFAFTLVSAQGVDLDKSSMIWTGKKIGKEHTGGVEILQADFDYEDGKLVSGTLVIDMTTITCTDLEEEKAAKLVGHLKSSDFFDVDAFPEAELNFTSVTQVEGDSYLIKGEITIKGHTEPIEFYANLKEKEALATIRIDRSKFDVRYGSASFFDDIGDSAIDDIFEIKARLVYQ